MTKAVKIKADRYAAYRKNIPVFDMENTTCPKNIFAFLTFMILFLSGYISYAQFFSRAVATLKQDIIQEAEWALKQNPETITSWPASRSAGGSHDFSSEGDYWWPDPLHPDSAYIQKDGQTNPDNFTAHRLVMIRFSRIMGALASAYKITGDEKYAKACIKHADAWFKDELTRMNPNLLYAQSIKGRVTGRGIGIIDTIHLMEVSQALLVISESKNADPAGYQSWFKQYLQWLTTHPYGIAEMNAANNHGTCWVMQVAAFARFTGDEKLMEFCRDRFKNKLLPEQMAADGSFPLELKRTKPYGYSLFNLDAMVMIAQILSDGKSDLYRFQTPDGKSLQKGLEFLFPYIKDKNQWPYPKDVMYWDEWPVAQPCLLFGALAYGIEPWFVTWQQGNHQPAEAEVIRNLPVRNPLLWMTDREAEGDQD